MARERKPISPAQLAIAAQRSKAGVSMREIARDLGLDRRTLARRLEQEAPDAVPDALDREVDPDDALDREAAKAAAQMDLSGTPEEQRERLQASIAEQQRIVAKLNAAGEYAEARKQLQVQLQAENILRAVNKTHDPDVIEITRAQLAEAAREAEATICRFSEARPNLCAHCSRELSLRWAGATEEERT